jgi:hypothetical protein
VFEAYFFAFCSFGVNGLFSLDGSNSSRSTFGKPQNESKKLMCQTT